LKMYLKMLQFVLRSKIMNMRLGSLARKDIGNRHLWVTPRLSNASPELAAQQYQ
jgi:hypothetical protein